MPTYDYRCRACGHSFEKYQPITGPAVRKCPVCGKSKVKRLIGAGAGIIFKGSGFYQTDYRSDSYRKAAEKEKTGSAGPSDSSKPPAADTSKKQSPPAKKGKP